MIQASQHEMIFERHIMNTSRKAIAKQANAKGVMFALVQGDESFEVWVLRENYNRECKGGMKKTWRYVAQGLTRDAAEKLFTRRIGKVDALTSYYADRANSELANRAR